MAMLKRDELTSVPAAAGDLNALLGRGSEFEGKLTFEGTVRIDGKFTGTIVTNDVLVVGEGAKIQAEVTCGTIIVHGEINGDIKAKSAVELHHPARMKGNIETTSLMIEKGVAFEGQCKMDVRTGEVFEAAPVAVDLHGNGVARSRRSAVAGVLAEEPGPSFGRLRASDSRKPARDDPSTAQVDHGAGVLLARVGRPGR